MADEVLVFAKPGDARQFFIDEGGKLKCTLCNEKYGSSTSPTRMMAHLAGAEHAKAAGIGGCKPVNTPGNILKSIERRKAAVKFLQESQKEKVAKAQEKEVRITVNGMAAPGSLHLYYNNNTADAATMAVVMFLLESGIAFNVVRSPAFFEMLEAVKKAPVSWKGPTYNAVRTNLLDKAHEHVQDLMSASGVDTEVEIFGLTVAADAYKDATSRQIIGYVGNTSNGSVRFLGSMSTEGESQTADYLFEHAVKVIEAVGAKTVKAFITDSASNEKGCGKLLEARYPWLLHLPCAAHGTDLLLADIGKLPWAKDAIDIAHQIVVYFRKYEWAQALLREESKKGSKKELVLPGNTRFGTALIMISRVVEMRADLESSVRNKKYLDHLPKTHKKGIAPPPSPPKKKKTAGGASLSGAGGVAPSCPQASKGKSPRLRKPSFKSVIATPSHAGALKPGLAVPSAKEKAVQMAKTVRNNVLDDDAWLQLEFLVDICKPIYALLRFCDSNKLGIGKLYYRFCMLLVWVEACFGDVDKQALWKEYRTASLKAEHGPRYKVTKEDLFMPSIVDAEHNSCFEAGSIKAALIDLITSRWNFLHRDAHGAAYCLDPESWGHIISHDPNGEVVLGLNRILERLTNSAKECAEARLQWLDYKLKMNSFSGTNLVMWEAARKMPAHLWWYEFALPKAPELSKVAMRLLSICVRSSGLERAWSTYEFIHNRRRNRLRATRASKLVDIFSNMKLVRMKARKAASGLEGLPIPWMWELDGKEDEDVEEDERMSEVEELVEEDDDLEMMLVG
ncbi:hypothetical protein FOA52_015316 [Chlamydomonas sp. UWO 241]|nr:hypothetical protein FOA52_015316 [Chlamydomonas sp. UWO 241]